MICVARYSGAIIKGDIITKRIYEQVQVTKKDLITLLNRTYVIVGLLLNG
jgi:hypothetical protein